jgi:hypothetical protein
MMAHLMAHPAIATANRIAMTNWAVKSPPSTGVGTTGGRPITFTSFDRLFRHDVGGR